MEMKMIQNEGQDEMTIVREAIAPRSNPLQELKSFGILLALTALATGVSPTALFEKLGAVLATLQDSPLTMRFAEDDPRTAVDVVKSAMEKVNAERRDGGSMDDPSTLTAGEALILLTYAAPVITGYALGGTDKDGNRVF